MITARKVISAERNPSEHITLDGIKQFYINVEEERFKLTTVGDLLEDLSFTQMVIYLPHEVRRDSIAI